MSDKKNAKLMKERLKELGNDVSLGHCYEVLANLDGYQTRNHAVSAKVDEFDYDEVIYKVRECMIDGKKVLSYEFFATVISSGREVSIGVIDFESNGSCGGCIKKIHLDNEDDHPENMELQARCETAVRCLNGEKLDEKELISLLQKQSKETLYEIQSDCSKQELVEDILEWIEEGNEVTISSLLGVSGKRIVSMNNPDINFDNIPEALIEDLKKKGELID